MTKEEALLEFFEEYCKKVDITVSQLLSTSRQRKLVEKRMVLACVLRRSLGMTLNEVGRALDKHHASIIHSIKQIENFIVVYPHIREYYDIAEDLLLEYKAKLVDYYNLKSITAIERNEKLVEILLDNNRKLESKIMKLKNTIEVLNK
tara:strand:+ start:307 stop:750 length:444 start_codon:yes stop_codon:yes gene_type:complete